jgi:cytochrome c oxidase cbb3-type subunit 3
MTSRVFRILTIACVLLPAAACKRETRALRTDPPVVAALDRPAPMPNRINGAPPRVISAQGEPFESNAWQLNQGKQLYTWFNCKTCHANGGGDSGPALMDGWWRYGPDQLSIFLSIRDGRPNGMPAFRDYLTSDQIWQLTGYVRTIGAYSGKTAAPSRNDEMQSRPSENRAPAAIDVRRPPSR